MTVRSLLKSVGVIEILLLFSFLIFPFVLENFWFKKGHCYGIRTKSAIKIKIIRIFTWLIMTFQRESEYGKAFV